MSLPVEHRQAHLCGRGFRPTAATATSGRSRTQAENKDAGLGKAAGEVVGTRHPEGEGEREAVGTGGPTRCHRWERHWGLAGEAGAGGDRGCSRQNKQVGAG